MANTIERRKIKGGKYELFLADNDGNIIEFIDSKDLKNTIEALRYLADDGDLDAKKVILDYEILLNFVCVWEGK